jgi:N utilization substance protein B
LDILFECDLRATDLEDTLSERTADADPPVREYTGTLVKGVAWNLDEIDERIRSALREGWTLERMPRVDRNLVRIAVYELLYTDLPGKVAIAEAVSLAGELSTDESPGFVNGVLTVLAAG